MSKALFFNALPDSSSETGYDRNYNADDLSEFLRIVCDTGVVKTNSESGEPLGLKVISASGMTINVNDGKAVIKGKGFINDTLQSFSVPANGNTVNRYDFIVIEFNNNVSVRDIAIKYRTGTISIPTVSSLTRNDKIYEVMLAYITVAPSATSITQTNITDTRGNADLCPWFTAVKGYEEYYDAIIQTHESTETISSITSTVVTDIPSALYNERYSLVEVYTNGIKEPKNAFNVSVSGGYIVITFTSTKAVGTVVTTVIDNFLDGEGMSTALAQYTQLLQDVTDLKTGNEVNYICNGVNDNILISNIVRAFYSVNDYKSLKLNIIGNLGISTAFSGTGTAANPYAFFDFTKQINTNRVATLDFSNCSAINPHIDYNTVYYIFRGEEIKIIGAAIVAGGNAGNTVKVFSSNSGRIYAKNCRFWITPGTASVISHTGTFVNCRGSVSNNSGNSYCFLTATTGLLRLIGGEYYAYTAEAGAISAVLGQSGAEAVSILYGVNAPTLERSGFFQTNSIYQASGGGMINCTDLISALPMIVRDGANNTRGTIAKSKPGLM